MVSAVQPIFTPLAARLPRVAIFLSGSGSNAERVLEQARQPVAPAFEAVVLVTDTPATSRAHELGRTYGVPVVANDIRQFYRERGETRVTLATPAGRELREQWTAALRAQLRPCAIDFGVLAGFVPLTNLTGDFPCLNVHPGDLTFAKNGQRYLVGLHTVPIERAILEGLDQLRSSVIQALPYTGRGDDMDNGPLLGLSPAVPIDLEGTPLAEWRQIAAARPAVRPSGGYGDALEQLARKHQERLKVGGDWVVLPRVVTAFAEGRYGRDATGLCFRAAREWQPVTTVVFGPAGLELRPRGSTLK